MSDILSTRLRELRGSMSQQDFANKIGVKQTSYSSWERGVKDPAASTIATIASTFGVSSDWLLGLSQTQGTPTVNAGSGAAVNIGSGSATAGGDCSKCRLMQAHVRQITGRG